MNPDFMWSDTVYVYTHAGNDPYQVGRDLSDGNYYATLEDCIAANPYTINKIDDIARVTIEHLNMTDIRAAIERKGSPDGDS